MKLFYIMTSPSLPLCYHLCFVSWITNPPLFPLFLHCTPPRGFWSSFIPSPFWGAVIFHFLRLTSALGGFMLLINSSLLTWSSQWICRLCRRHLFSKIWRLRARAVRWCKKVVGSNLGCPGLFCVEFACSPSVWASSGCSSFPHHQTHIYTHARRWLISGVSPQVLHSGCQLLLIRIG